MHLSFPARPISKLLVVAGLSALMAACSDGARTNAPEPVAGGMSGSFVLALSWEPAFCETRPKVPECRTQTAERIDAAQFSLHGLWPEGAYCGVDDAVRADDEAHRWDELPEVELPIAQQARLDAAMPGTQSGLERHEWIKHGTCSGTDQMGYYAASLALTDAVNASGLPQLFAGSLGMSLNASRIADAFDEAFGAGTGERVTLECVSDGSRRLISGIRITLEGTITPTPDLGALARAASPRSGGCRGGVVDPVGLQ